MHSPILALSAAIMLLSSSVTVLGNTENFVGGLTSTVTESNLLYPELAMAQGQVGILRRRKVNDLANGPRYGFPATEKKAVFGQNMNDKRSIVAMLTQPQQASKPQQGEEGEEGGDDEEGGNSREAKRSLKARRRLQAKRDLKGAAVKTQMGVEGILGETQNEVTNTQKSVNKIVGQVGRTAGGAALSLSDHPAQSKAADTKSTFHADDVAPAPASGKKSTTGEVTKGDETQHSSSQVDSAPPSSAVAGTSSVNDPNSQFQNTAPSDSLKMNPAYTAPGSGPQDFSSQFYSDED